MEIHQKAMCQNCTLLFELIIDFNAVLLTIITHLFHFGT